MSIVAMGLLGLIILGFGLFILSVQANHKKKKSQSYPSKPSDYRQSTRSRKKEDVGDTDDLTTAALVSEALDGIDNSPVESNSTHVAQESDSTRASAIVSAAASVSASPASFSGSPSTSDTGGSSSASSGGDSGGGGD